MSCGCQRNFGCSNGSREEERGRQRFTPCQRALHGLKHDAIALGREVEALQETVENLNRRIAEAEEHCVRSANDDDDDDNNGCNCRRSCRCGCHRPCGCGCGCGCRPQTRCGCN